MRIRLRLILMLVSIGLAVAPVAAQTPAPEAPGSHWAIALHGGAGTIPKDLNPALAEAYRVSLRRGLELGRGILAKGGTSLDAVEAVVQFFEDDSLFNAGKGAVYTHTGTHELDAAIMNGATLILPATLDFCGLLNSP